MIDRRHMYFLAVATTCLVAQQPATSWPKLSLCRHLSFKDHAPPWPRGSSFLIAAAICIRAFGQSMPFSHSASKDLQERQIYCVTLVFYRWILWCMVAVLLVLYGLCCVQMTLPQLYTLNTKPLTTLNKGFPWFSLSGPRVLYSSPSRPIKQQRQSYFLDWWRSQAIIIPELNAQPESFTQ